jgi:hypothetical protein
MGSRRVSERYLIASTIGYILGSAQEWASAMRKRVWRAVIEVGLASDEDTETSGSAGP